MKIIPIALCCVAMLVGCKDRAEDSHKSLKSFYKLSVACQNAAFHMRLGHKEDYNDLIQEVDEAMATLLEAGELKEQKVIMIAPDKMTGAWDRNTFCELRMDFIEKLTPKYGAYTVNEMIGWEFRDQLEGGRLYHETRDSSKDVMLRVRLPEKDLKDFLELLRPFFVEQLPANTPLKAGVQAQ